MCRFVQSCRSTRHLVMSVPYRWFTFPPLMALTALAVSVAEYQSVPPADIQVNAGATVGDLPHFWTSTGFCPPDPHQDPSQLTNGDVITSMALIGGLPWRGLEQVRVHWLLDLVKPGSAVGGEKHNFTFLDTFLDSLVGNGLRPGFELMGNPGGQFTDFLSEDQLQRWTDLVWTMAKRYIARYGVQEVRRWNFETWNEPDHHDFDTLNMTVTGYLRYFAASRAGLRTADGQLRLGGPGGSCRAPHFTVFCWALLGRATQLDFVSFHRKGAQEVTSILPSEVGTIRRMRASFPHLQRLPIFNDEADPEKGWWRARPWRADVTYAAMIASNVILHQQWRTASRDKYNYGLLSNDNAFLNYHPHFFQQRTLLARFQMNRTADRHSEFVLKPCFSVMALLSLTGSSQLQAVSKHTPRSLYVLPSIGDIGRSVTVVLSFGDSADTSGGPVTSVHLHVSNITRSPGQKWMYAVYMMDNRRTNPYQIWVQQGRPVYPSREQLNEMRQAQGVRRLAPPRPLLSARLSLKLRLRMPGVALVHACAVTGRPGPVRGLRVLSVTRGAVLLVWDDQQLETRCILTYEVQFRATNQHKFRRINAIDTIFNLFQWCPDPPDDTTDPARGWYRVRAVDYTGTAGPFSPTAVY